MSALVRVAGVRKDFKRGAETIHVLEALDLDVEKGEFLALMGPSGSGKSTLLNLIGGLDRPTGGTVEVGGTRIDNLSNRKLASWRARHVGFVFQFYNLLPVLTAARNVELPLLLTPLGKKERRQPGRDGPRHRRALGSPQALSQAALRRRAAAGRHRPGHRQRPELDPG